MRGTGSIVTAAASAVLLAITLLFAAPPAMAIGPDTDQLVRDGKVVSMTGTTVEIKEWGGTYTYRLSPTGRQALDAAQIRAGDQVRFSVYSPWGVAYDFAQLRRDPRNPALSRDSKKMDQHIAVSPDTGQRIIGG